MYQRKDNSALPTTTNPTGLCAPYLLQLVVAGTVGLRRPGARTRDAADAAHTGLARADGAGRAGRGLE